MGYFSNGSAGMDYEARFCDRCVHQNGKDGKSGCAVMLAHNLNNYKECNNEESILHLLIPRDSEGWNQECQMFLEGDAPSPDEAMEKYEKAMKEGL
jgi:hypothetical protein